ncbi:hypothetical protein D9M72_646240 [compost metagenome]
MGVARQLKINAQSSAVIDAIWPMPKQYNRLVSTYTPQCLRRIRHFTAKLLRCLVAGRCDNQPPPPSFDCCMFVDEHMHALRTKLRRPRHGIEVVLMISQGNEHALPGAQPA